MLEAEISGVSEALGNLTERGATEPVVKATVTLSESGFVSLTQAIAFGEIKDESIAGAWHIMINLISILKIISTGKLKGFFGSGNSAENDDTVAQAVLENALPRDSATDSAAVPSPSASDEKSAEKDKKVLPKDLNTIKLNITTNFASIPPMTVPEKREARNRFVVSRVFRRSVCFDFLLIHTDYASSIR